MTGADVVPFVPAITALIAVVGAITAALIQGQANVRAQVGAQREIQKREAANQARIDMAVREQICSLIDNVHTALSFQARKPHYLNTTLFRDFERFMARLPQLDVAIAIKSDVLGDIYNAESRLAKTIEIIREGQERLAETDVPADEAQMIRGTIQLSSLEDSIMICALLEDIGHSHRASKALRHTKNQLDYVLPEIDSNEYLDKDAISAMKDDYARQVQRLRLV